jgi:hypothetical protein
MIEVVFQGGLGNQLFQLSLVLYLKKQAKSVYINAVNYTTHDMYHGGFTIQRLIDLSDLRIIFPSKSTLSRRKKLIKKMIPLLLKKKIYRMLGYFRIYFYKIINPTNQTWTEEMFSNRVNSVTNFTFCSETNYKLIGYWQDEDMVNEVLHLLKERLFSVSILIPEHSKLMKDICTSESVLIHFRGGDFSDKKNKLRFDILTVEYYKSCIEKMQSVIKNPKFFIYFDDINQMNRLLPQTLKDSNTIGMLSDDPVYDFQFQMKHKYFICSNSTFSWWTAKLSETKEIVLIPEKITNQINKKTTVTKFIEQR